MLDVKGNFKLINVVDVLITDNHTGYQLFITNSSSLDTAISEHTAMIQAAIIHSKIPESPIFWRGEQIQLINGFNARFGRLPTLDDKIQIIATDFFKVFEMNHSYTVRSLLDFNVL